MAQKYDNGASLFLIQYDKNRIVKARVIVYDLEKHLYKVAIMGEGTDITSEVNESSLIIYDEIAQPGNSINEAIPDNYENTSPGHLFFTSDEQIFVGTINSLGQWKDIASDSFIKDVSYWMHAR